MVYTAGFEKRAVPLIFTWAEHASADYSLGLGWLLSGTLASLVWYSLFLLLSTTKTFVQM